MWVYIKINPGKIDEEYQVGYWVEGQWHGFMKYDEEWDAIKQVNFLNGGEAESD